MYIYMQKYIKTIHDLMLRETSKAYIIIFIISLFSMFLELLFMNIYAFVSSSIISTWIIAISIMGFGFGGTLAFYLKGNDFTLFLILFCVSIYAIFMCIVRVPIVERSVTFTQILVHSILLSLPFLVVGYIFSQMLKICRPSIAFFHNFLGSVAGVALAFNIIPLIGGENSLILISLIFPASLIFFMKNKLNLPHIFIFIISLVILLIIFRNEFNIVSQLYKVYPKHDTQRVIFPMLDSGWKNFYTKWAMPLRLDVMEKEHNFMVAYGGSSIGVPYRDSGADILLPCLFRNFSKVLIVGSGAGMDINLLKKYGIKNITAVEICGDMIDIVKNILSNYSNSYENVSIEKIDGRKFIKKTDEKFDLIAFPLVDSPSAITDINSDNYLFTIDGIEEFLQHLDKNGILCFAHLYPYLDKYLPPIVNAVKSIGEDPNKNIIFFTSDRSRCFGRDQLKIKNKEYILNECRTIHVIVKRTKFLPNEEIAIKNISLLSETEIPIFNESYVTFFPFSFPNNESWNRIKNNLPTTDNRPYLYRQSFEVRPIEKEIFIFSLISGLIVLTIVYFIKLKIRTHTPYRLLFSSAFLGTSFMMLETAIMQKSSILFDNPAITISTVLSSFMLFSGIGALISERIKKNKIAIKIGIILIPIFIIYSFFMLEWLKNENYLLRNTWLMFSIFLVSISFTCVLIGIPFPYLLSKVKNKEIPLFYAVDSIFTPIGIISSMILSILFGFQVSFITSSLLYTVAIILLII